MIRFACPGCAATFTVDESKAGKVGKCPKCQSQFQIPKPDPTLSGDAPPALPAAAPPPPPPPAAPRPPVIAPVASASLPSATVEIAPCPKCSARLTVGVSDLGAEVECPYCKAIYKAVRGDSIVPAPAPADDFASLGDDDDERPSKPRDSRSSKRNPRDDDEDDRPSKRKSRRDDDDDDRPSKRKKSKRRSRGGSNQESKRITAGILALLLGGFGVHKFYLGYTGAGVIMILLACVGVSGFIALAEGIIYLTKSDEEFIETY